MSAKFTNFISDPAVCRAAEDYWRQLFAELPCRPLQHGWTPWGATTYLDEEGGNIFAAKDDAARRGISIVMCPRFNARIQLVAWTSWYGEATDPDSIGYIKITLLHTDETENIARELLIRFVCGGASLEEMDVLIQEMGVDMGEQST